MCKWETKKLGEIVEYGKDKIGIDLINHTNYISTENMIENFGGITHASSLPSQKTTSHFKKNDILFSNIRTYFKKVWLAQFDGGCSNDVLVIRPKNNCLDNRYLYYILTSESLTAHSIQTSKGTKMPRGDKQALLNYEINLPSLPKQQRIANILSILDDKIALNREMNKTLEAMAQAIFKSWFVDFEPFKEGAFVESELGMIPKGWEVKTIEDVCDFQNGYAFKSKEMSEDPTDSYKVFKMGNIKKGGGLNKTGSKDYFPKNLSSKLDRYLVKKGDLLMCMTDMKDNVALLGHTALMDEDDIFILNQRVGLIRSKDKSIANYPFLYILTNSENFIMDLRKRANSGVQVNLSTAEIKKTKFVLPPKQVHEEFDKLALSLQEKIFKLEQENETLSTLRDTLLPKLLSGEIEI
ncbi:MAG: restriction endonuclease subunit S [Sulfuricurvum sp.]|nr:restriction endonuclease subunit S [Sulfuricurvum sp.]